VNSGAEPFVKVGLFFATTGEDPSVAVACVARAVPPVNGQGRLATASVRILGGTSGAYRDDATAHLPGAAEADEWQASDQSSKTCQQMALRRC
jgi:hypothetical protein